MGDDRFEQMMRALRAVEAREADSAEERPEGMVDLPGGARPAERLLPPEPPKKPASAPIPERPAAPPAAAAAASPAPMPEPMRAAAASETATRKPAASNPGAPLPKGADDWLQPAWGDTRGPEPERKVSLGDVAKKTKDYEREPKNWK
jgi:hypothetical protein